MLNTAPLYLNSWLKNHRPDLHANIEWTKIEILLKTQQHLIQAIESLNIDILCLGMYVWNAEHILESIKGIKQKVSKSLTVITGGPESSPNFRPNFLPDNPDIDFAIYGQGEEAFVHVLDHIFNNKKFSLLSSNNLAWRGTDNSVKIGTFKWINNKELSPYVESQDLLSQMINDPDLAKFMKVLPYETSRGCAYKCSFCDWTSGLSHKVYHRSFDIEKEIDVLGRLGATNIYFADANFGQHRQDKVVAETLVKFKQEKKYDFVVYGQNWSKLKKDAAFEIIDILVQGNLLTYFKFAVQDTSSEILDNINRPDIPWPDHKALIVTALEKYPQIKEVWIELIQGLPGQTRQSWKQNFIECQDFSSLVYPFTILSAAPVGYDNEYREKMKIQTCTINTPMVNNFKSLCVIATLSYNFDDYVYFTLISELMNPQNPFSKIKNRAHLFNLVDNYQFLSETLISLKQCMTDMSVSFYEFKTEWNNQITKFARQLVQLNPDFWAPDWLLEFDRWADKLEKKSG